VERSEAEAIYAAGREPAVEALVELSARLEAQDAQLAALSERVEELEQRLKRDSSNSSLPPSHDPPWLGKRARSRGTGRKAGAQPGHHGHGRSLFPIERVTEIVDHWPERCSCGHAFGEDEREPADAPARHQVAELPPLAVEINEHRLQRLCCLHCGRTVRAELPSGVPRGCFGPKLEAAIASLTVRNRLSRRQLVELMEELFGCPIAVGTVDTILARTAETLEPVYDELLEQTRTARPLNVDETGWYLSGEPRTLWGAFSKQTAVLRIAPDRGKQHLHGLIGDDFAGVVGSDRFSAYNSLEPERRQVCWSHLRRDFTFHADLGLGAQETFGLDGPEVTWNVFHAWKQFQQDGDRERSSSASPRSRPRCCRCWNGAQLESGNATCGRSRRTCSSSGRPSGRSPTCPMSSRPTTPPSAACAPPRAAVIYRKLSLGSRSQGGERTIERLLSVDQTCRLQRRSLYGYLAGALTAKARGDPVPSL
jgi:transposase